MDQKTREICMKVIKSAGETSGESFKAARSMLGTIINNSTYMYCELMIHTATLLKFKVQPWFSLAVFFQAK